MKKILFWVTTLLIFISILNENVSAQENSSMNFKIFGGASFPISDYGATSGERAGFASIGYSIMLEGTKYLSQNVNWISSVTISTNGFDNLTLEKSLPNSQVNAGSYNSIWILTGISPETNLSSEIKLYGLVEAGLLFSIFPAIHYYDFYKGTKNLASQKGISLAYCLGGGVNINKINVGIRFNAGYPKYKQSFTNGLLDSREVKLPLMILQFFIGINL